MRPQFVASVDYPIDPSEANYLKLLRDKGVAILKENVYQGESDTGYTTASGRTLTPGSTKARFLYPFQWLWDTFFIAGWSEDTEQNIKDVRKFFASQSPNGFLGHIRYNREILAKKEYFPPPNIYYPSGLPIEGEIVSRITQPPNVGYGIYELAKKIKSAKRRAAFLKETFPKAVKYHEYLYNNLVKDGLVVTIHPWQAGDDNSPKWDPIYTAIRKRKIHEKMKTWLKGLGLAYDRVDVKIIHHTQRPKGHDYDIYLYLIWLYNEWEWKESKILESSPFRVVDPLINSVFQRSNHCLLEIAEEIGAKNEIEMIKGWITQTHKGIESLWDEKAGMYYAKDLHSDSFIKLDSIGSLMPLFSHEITKERAMILASKIKIVEEDNPLIYLIPSTFPGQESFEPVRYWRGPVWIIVNALIADGLFYYGYDTLAKKICFDSLKLVYHTLSDNGGFCEYFDPLTGKGLGSPLQSWTAAAVLYITEMLVKYKAAKVPLN
jgi:hypothetical protein